MFCRKQRKTANRHFTLIEVLVAGLLTGLVVTVAILILQRAMNFYKRQDARQTFSRESHDLFAALGRDLRGSVVATTSLVENAGAEGLTWHGDGNLLVVPKFRHGRMLRVVYKTVRDEDMRKHPEKRSHSVVREVRSFEDELIKKQRYEAVTGILFGYATRAGHADAVAWSSVWEAARDGKALPRMVKVRTETANLPGRQDHRSLTSIFALPLSE